MMIRFGLSLLVAACCGVHGCAQWECVGGGFQLGGVFDIKYESAFGRLFVAGSMHNMVTDSVLVKGVAVWDQSGWRPLGKGVTQYGGSPPKALMITDTALIVAGGFQEMDSVPNTQWAAQWKGDAWHSMGITSGTTGSCSALRLDTLGGELHLFGPCQFGTSPAMSNWLTWDGGEWRQYDSDEPFDGYTAAACRYQGQVHVAGNFWTVNGATDVARYTGSTWEELGPGVAGDPFMTDMLVYDDLLWVCGDIAASAGNPANALLAWDGTQWLDPFPQITHVAYGRDLLVANGKLYYTGTFVANGLDSAYALLEYDGQQVCVMGGSGPVLGRIAASADTLYAATGEHLFGFMSGPLMNFIGKWPLNAPRDTCFALPQSMGGGSDRPLFWSAAPNPNQGQFTLRGPGLNDLRELEAVDALGRSVWVEWSHVEAGSVEVRCAGTGLITLRGRTADRRGQARVLVEP